MQIIRGKIESAQKVMIYGPEGIGKSTLAAQFPGALFIDTEGSTKHLDVARTPAPSSWTMLLQQVEHIKQNPDLCRTLVIDTADWAERLAIADICARYKKTGIEDFSYGKGYVYLSEEFGRLLNLLTDLIDLGINVVLTAHAHMRKFEQPDEMGAYDRWELKLQRRTAPLPKEWADMVLFLNYKTLVVKNEETGSHKGQGGKRVMYTAHHPAWDAKNRHDLPEELPLDFSAIAHCFPAAKNLAEVAKPEPKPEPKSRPKPEPDPKPAKSKPVTVADAFGPSKPEPKPDLAPLPDVSGLDDVPEPEPEPKPKPEPKPEPKPDADAEILAALPRALTDLMAASGVTYGQIQDAVGHKGYYPANTPIENYDPQFIEGVLIGAWPQVLEVIKEIHIPF